LPIIVAFLGGEEMKEAQRRLLDSGATAVATSCRDVVAIVHQLSPRAAPVDAPAREKTSESDSASEPASAR
jgi:hypothetical protein